MSKLEGIPNTSEDKSQEEIEAGRLSNKDAQEEANMMRAYDEKDQKSHPRKYVDKDNMFAGGVFAGMPLEVEPTAEDYDKALAAIEEMKELARREPVDVKVWYKIARGIHGLGKVQRFIVDAILFGSDDGDSSKFGGPGTEVAKGIRETVSDYDLNIEEILTDAAKILRELKKSGESFGHVSAETFKAHKIQREEGEGMKKAA